jgi:SAM-dependent methyltransferase
MAGTPLGAWRSPSTQRNRQPILEVLAPRLADATTVLEIASGAGEHAAFIAAALPHVTWQPSDADAAARASIAAWREASKAPNLAEPLAIDAADPADWPAATFDAVVCINMIHISPWRACEGLMTGAGQVLAPGGQLFLYGPFLEADVATAPGNVAFDQDLKSRNPAWGLRHLAEVEELARARGLRRTERIAMPANNLVVVFRKVR